MKRKLGLCTVLAVVLAFALALASSNVVSALLASGCVVCDFNDDCERGPFCAEHENCVSGWGECVTWGVCEIW